MMALVLYKISILVNNIHFNNLKINDLKYFQARLSAGILTKH